MLLRVHMAGCTAAAGVLLLLLVPTSSSLYTTIGLDASTLDLMLVVKRGLGIRQLTSDNEWEPSRQDNMTPGAIMRTTATTQQPVNCIQFI